MLAGLAWYYMLAAMMNAAAAALRRLRRDGLARARRGLGLAPKTRRMPAWLISSFFGLYGLAFLIILLRESLPGAIGVVYGLCAAANALLAVMAGADAAHFAEMKAHGHGEGDAATRRALTNISPPSGWASRSIARSGP